MLCSCPPCGLVVPLFNFVLLHRMTLRLADFSRSCCVLLAAVQIHVQRNGADFNWVFFTKVVYAALIGLMRDVTLRR